MKPETDVVEWVRVGLAFALVVVLWWWGLSL